MNSSHSVRALLACGQNHNTKASLCGQQSLFGFLCNHDIWISGNWFHASGIVYKYELKKLINKIKMQNICRLDWSIDYGQHTNTNRNVIHSQQKLMFLYWSINISLCNGAEGVETQWSFQFTCQSMFLSSPKTWVKGFMLTLIMGMNVMVIMGTVLLPRWNYCTALL